MIEKVISFLIILRLYCSPSKEDFLVKANLTGNINASLGYSGLIYLDSLCSDVFFWFVPAVKENKILKPIFIWLPDRNYDSAIHSFLEEITSFTAKADDSFEYRKDTINEAFSILLLDFPSGVGYSHKNNNCKKKDLNEECFQKGYIKSQCGISHSFKEFMLKFQTIFTKETNKGFYLGGKDYAGKYAISIAHDLIDDVDIGPNLKGLVLEAPLIDPVLQTTSYPLYLLYTGYATTKEFKTLNSMVARIMLNYELKEYTKSTDLYAKLMKKIKASLWSFSGIGDISKTRQKEERGRSFYACLLNKEAIKESLNIPLDRSFANDRHGAHIFKNDTIMSVAAQLKKVTKHYRMFIYQGQFSTYNNVAGYLSTFKEISPSFSDKERDILIENNETAGYLYKNKRISFMVVIRSGWSTISEKPKLISKMVDKAFQ